jgi:hypothetical protein
LFEYSLQTLGDKLTRAINVRAVFELQRHLREPELREGTHFFHAGQTGDFAFDGLRDELFRFLGGKRRNFGVHLHLHARDVRHGVDRQMQRGPQTRAKQRDSAKQNERALAQREFEDAVNHGASFPAACQN